MFFSSPNEVELKGIRLQMTDDYRDAIRILQKCSKFTEDDIKTFKRQIDDFFHLCGEIWCRERGSHQLYPRVGQLSPYTLYMKTHGNLYKYLQ